MPKTKKRKPVSKAQARLFGAVAGGANTKATGLTPAKAKADLRSTKLKGLPEKKTKKKTKKKGAKKRRKK